MAQNSLNNKPKNSLVEHKQTFSSFMSNPAIQKKIAGVVKGKDGDRFITSLVSAVATNPALAECEHFTTFSAGLLGEALKLSPSPQLGQYYLVPFNDKKRNCKVCQFQLGYKGYIQLAIRSGMYKKLNVQAVKEGELVKYDPFNEEIEIKLIENPDEREKAETTGYYAMFEYTNGFKKCMYWSKEKMLAHADKYSMAFSKDAYNKLQNGQIPQSDLWKYSSFWYKDFDGMAFKTMLRQLISKWGIMSVELQTAIDKDMAVMREDGTTDYIDNQPVETGYINAEYTEVNAEEAEQVQEPKAAVKEVKKTVTQPSIVPPAETKQEEQDPFGYDDPFNM